MTGLIFHKELYGRPAARLGRIIIKKETLTKNPMKDDEVAFKFTFFGGMPIVKRWTYLKELQKEFNSLHDKKVQRTKRINALLEKGLIPIIRIRLIVQYWGKKYAAVFKR